ncbi:MAG: hypothetical protein CVU08_10805 [Bacteroidetes bacterium HGW-Bacteroidetes-3]|nr:MAG: hypothetical protein CVU08_10805 [Bacteroidetes bacterium HGW-Bacteroidetes-3]
MGVTRTCNEKRDRFLCGHTRVKNGNANQKRSAGQPKRSAGQKRHFTLITFIKFKFSAFNACNFLFISIKMQQKLLLYFILITC